MANVSIVMVPWLSNCPIMYKADIFFFKLHHAHNIVLIAIFIILMPLKHFFKIFFGHYLEYMI